MVCCFCLVARAVVLMPVCALCVHIGVRMSACMQLTMRVFTLVCACMRASGSASGDEGLTSSIHFSAAYLCVFGGRTAKSLLLGYSCEEIITGTEVHSGHLQYPSSSVW